MFGKYSRNLFSFSLPLETRTKVEVFKNARIPIMFKKNYPHSTFKILLSCLFGRKYKFPDSFSQTFTRTMIKSKQYSLSIIVSSFEARLSAEILLGVELH